MGSVIELDTRLKKIEGAVAKSFGNAAEIAAQTLRGEGHTAAAGYSEARGDFVKSDCGKGFCLVPGEGDQNEYRVPVYDH